MSVGRIVGVGGRATATCKRFPSHTPDDTLSPSCPAASVLHSNYSLLLQLFLLGSLVVSAGASPLAVSNANDVTTFSLRNAYDNNPLARPTRLESPDKSDALALDPRRIMCGYQLIVNLKLQCGSRGTYSPYDHGARIRRSLRMVSSRNAVAGAALDVILTNFVPRTELSRRLLGIPSPTSQESAKDQTSLLQAGPLRDSTFPLEMPSSSIFSLAPAIFGPSVTSVNPLLDLPQLRLNNQKKAHIFLMTDFTPILYIFQIFLPKDSKEYDRGDNLMLQRTRMEPHCLMSAL
nr:unnamed protein product [Spirometra erinaceieuropaei]